MGNQTSQQGSVSLDLPGGQTQLALHLFRILTESTQQTTKYFSPPEDLAASYGREPAASDPQLCSICYEPICYRGRLDCCNHLFCIRDICEWSRRSNKCPCCRAEFGVISARSKSQSPVEAAGGKPDPWEPIPSEQTTSGSDDVLSNSQRLGLFVSLMDALAGADDSPEPQGSSTLSHMTSEPSFSQPSLPSSSPSISSAAPTASTTLGSISFVMVPSGSSNTLVDSQDGPAPEPDSASLRVPGSLRFSFEIIGRPASTTSARTSTLSVSSPSLVSAVLPASSSSQDVDIENQDPEHQSIRSASASAVVRRSRTDMRSSPYNLRPRDRNRHERRPPL